jgi:RNA polymerase sigma factor (sigma-70 family)
VPEAAGLLAGVSRGEVEGLIERGAAARAAIVASGLAAVLHWTGRIPPGMRQARDEFVGEASLRIVDRWDPGRATWGSFAYQEARYAYLENIRRRVQVREVVSERIGDFASGLERVVGPVSVPPEELLVLAEERARVAGLVDQLPGRLREVMVGRLGLAGREKTLAEIGTELGLSESTVHRDEAVGTRLLQQSHLATADQASVSSAVLLRRLAQALQPSAAASEASARQEQLRGRHVGRSRPVAR